MTETQTPTQTAQEAAEALTESGEEAARLLRETLGEAPTGQHWLDETRELQGLAEARGIGAGEVAAHHLRHLD